MIALRCVGASLLIALGLVLMSASVPDDAMARRNFPKPPTSCQGCKQAVANASDCK